MFYMRHRKICFRGLLSRKEVDSIWLHLGVIYLSPTGASVSREKIALVWRVEEDPFGVPSGRISI